MSMFRDLSGQTFGALTVLALDAGGSKEAGRPYWRCRCRCGVVKSTRGAYLTRRIKPCRSCGCMRFGRGSGKPANQRPRFKHVPTVGEKRGRLTFLRVLPGRGNRGQFQCDCGTLATAFIANVFRARLPVQSCGCLRGEATRKPCGEGAAHAFFITYQNNARNHGHAFKLSEAEFMTLASGVCWYCGAKPKVRRMYKWSNGACILNGIDRQDNTQGYVVTNCVPCCETCNRAKRVMPVKDYIEHCRRVIAWQDRKKETL